jgi:hypothetical protein
LGAADTSATQENSVTIASPEPTDDALAYGATGRRQGSVGVAVLYVGGGITVVWLGLLFYWITSLTGRLTGIF